MFQGALTVAFCSSSNRDIFHSKEQITGNKPFFLGGGVRVPPPTPWKRGISGGMRLRHDHKTPSTVAFRTMPGKGQSGILLFGVAVARGGEPSSPRSAINFFVRAEREAGSSEVRLRRPRKLTFHDFSLSFCVQAFSKGNMTKKNIRYGRTMISRIRWN